MTTKNELIFQLNCPWDNPYQGTDRKVLFVCSAGILRSATAARIYAKKHNTRCAGSEDYALVPVTVNLLTWANQIVFVNEENKYSVERKFGELTQWFNENEIVVLGIPDMYDHMSPKLIEEFTKQYETL
jgi:predicted protein tyrosine phosphatase